MAKYLGTAALANRHMKLAITSMARGKGWCEGRPSWGCREPEHDPGCRLALLGPEGALVGGWALGGSKTHA